MALDNYKISRELGGGSFGVVRLATDLSTSEQVAIKSISKTSIADIGEVERVSREFFILTCLDHENVIRLLEVTQDNRYLHLVMEYAGGGSLEDLVSKRPHGRLPEHEARRVFSQICSGVRYCHKKRVVHRDLKPDNILLSASGAIKVGDFGLSNTVSYGAVVSSPVGTPLFTAPEILCPHLYKTSDYNGQAADVWSMGVILYSIIVGDMPFPAKTLRALREQMTTHKIVLPPFVSSSCRELILSMLNTNPERRPSADEVFHHPWTQAAQGSLPHMLREVATTPRLDLRQSREVEESKLSSSSSSTTTTPAPAPLPASCAVGSPGLASSRLCSGRSGSASHATSNGAEEAKLDVEPRPARVELPPVRLSTPERAARRHPPSASTAASPAVAVHSSLASPSDGASSPLPSTTATSEVSGDVFSGGTRSRRASARAIRNRDPLHRVRTSAPSASPSPSGGGSPALSTMSSPGLLVERGITSSPASTHSLVEPRHRATAAACATSSPASQPAPDLEAPLVGGEIARPQTRGMRHRRVRGTANRGGRRASLPELQNLRSEGVAGSGAAGSAAPPGVSVSPIVPPRRISSGDAAAGTLSDGASVSSAGTPTTPTLTPLSDGARPSRRVSRLGPSRLRTQTRPLAAEAQPVTAGAAGGAATKPAGPSAGTSTPQSTGSWSDRLHKQGLRNYRPSTSHLHTARSPPSRSSLTGLSAAFSPMTSPKARATARRKSSRGDNSAPDTSSVPPLVLSPTSKNRMAMPTSSPTGLGKPRDRQASARHKRLGRAVSSCSDTTGTFPEL